MGLLNRKKNAESTASQPAAQAEPKQGRGRRCMYGHPVARGKKMCEHRHWVG